jgi:hypothetical protein
MPTPSLTVLARMLVITFDPVYATPIASPSDLLASSWSWAICSSCRGGAGIGISVKSGKHDLLFEQVTIRSRRYDLVNDRYSINMYFCLLDKLTLTFLTKLVNITSIDN